MCKRDTKLQTLWLAVSCACLSGCEPAPETTESQSRQSLFSSVQSSDDFKPVSAATPMRLPDDHGAHPQYQLEWWYLTLLLEDQYSQQYGVQYTLFRLADNRTAASDWGNQEMWMAHLSVHTATDHWFNERFGRGDIGNAGVTLTPFTLFLDDWQWHGSSNAPFPATLSLPVDETANISLSLSTTGPYVKHGNEGISPKSADGKFRSYYYSQPFIHASGTLLLDGKELKVSGNGWYDHEWTSHLAREEALGWDWFSLHLDDGRKLMAFRMHVDQQQPYVTGTLIQPDGTKLTLDQQSLAIVPTGYESILDREMPVHWQISLDEHAIDLTITPFKAGQWNPGTFGYYEGAVNISGSHSGKGFMELTGYQD